MTERDAFMSAILANPDDDVSRLVYADWLEEHGEPERAEFVRVQVEYVTANTRVGGTIERLRYLHERERALLRNSGPKWWNDLPGDYRATLESSPCIRTTEGWQYDVRRGFMDALHMPCADFLKHAADIFRAHPVTSVRLTDREPMDGTIDNTTWWSWTGAGTAAFNHHGTPDIIPDEILLLTRNSEGARVYGTYLSGKPCMICFPARKLGLAALSAACVRYGRAFANLPAWEPQKAGAPCS